GPGAQRARGRGACHRGCRERGDGGRSQDSLKHVRRMIIGPTYVKGIWRGHNDGMMHHRAASISGVWLLLAATTVSGQLAPAALALGQTCAFVTQAHADASAGTPNVNHDGSPLPGPPAPDIARGFQGIPRSAQPRLTASHQRILECTYRFAEADADMPYVLFIPSTYVAGKPAPLIVDLHGLNITPLMQMLFDGTTDLAERYGFIVVAPMGYSL